MSNEGQRSHIGMTTSASEATKIGSDMRVGISSFGAWMIGVGSIIGSIAWLFHGPMIARAGVVATTLAWMLAGFFMIPLAVILMELSSMFPTAGGPYVYKYYALKRAAPWAGELIGFLIAGWLYWVMNSLDCRVCPTGWLISSVPASGAVQTRAHCGSDQRSSLHSSGP